MERRGHRSLLVWLFAVPVFGFALLVWFGNDVRRFFQAPHDMMVDGRCVQERSQFEQLMDRLFGE